ncbi:MAG: hypothetical protein ONB48_17145 [candidate division KSB1 bacterium]|nr:hypothetical protein [candidate division KSB1 bacterium]MDZ7287373.1 hypothetical protein [candidate division KSB1 bacterium]MDZ7299487.1 hypothetical protein [candidate division KSB1 bacterium]MDZ7350351.1 hypothetical protein [candidate division KSB1 bacterium]MDZ7354723.1 hypothetical protein [candidate division KSB1 bacterium]
MPRQVLLWLLLLVAGIHEVPVPPPPAATPATEVAPPAAAPVASDAKVPASAPALPAFRQAEPPRQFTRDLEIPSGLAQFRHGTATSAYTPQRLLQPPTAHAREPFSPLKHTRPDAMPGIRWERLALVQTATLGIGGYGFVKYNGLFGRVGQPFKIGNDLTKDHTLLFDELLHFQGGYRITQAVAGIYNWAGVPPATADWIGAGTAAVVMTALEYVDGRRLHDEASYSDLVANFAGIGFALAKARVGFLRDFDLRFSYLTPADPFRHKTVKRYERMTHWLTYDFNRKLGLPFHLGFGYGVRRPFRPQVTPQYFVGIGLSPIDLLSHISPPLAKPLEFLRLYHFGNRLQL